MKPSEIVFDKSIKNRDKFGVFVNIRRKELGILLKEFACELNLTPAYITDIEKGNRAAPQKHLEKMIDILKIEDDEVEFFYDLAGCSHSNWQEINEYLSKTPNARKAIRLARDKNISEEEFCLLVSKIEELNDEELNLTVD